MVKRLSKKSLLLHLSFVLLFILLILFNNVKSEATTPDIRAGVRSFQTYINNNLPIQYLQTPLAVDGYAGPLTKSAAVKLLQYRLNVDYSAGLEIDGEFGPASQNAYDQYIKILKKGDLNDYVFILQGLLYCNNYDPKGFDGSYGFGGGTGCLNAVNQFKQDNGIDEYPEYSEFGYVGAKTMAKLCWKSYRLQDLSDGIYYIKNLASQYYMTVYQAGTTSGTDVIQYGFSGVSNQRWYVRKLDNGYYSVRPCHDLSFGLDLYSTSGNSNIDIWSCRRPPQAVPSYCEWRILYAGTDSANTLYRISPSNDLSTCASPLNLIERATIRQQNYANSQHQKWIFEKISDFIPIDSMNFSQSSITLRIGETKYMYPNRTPSINTDQLFYRSENSTIANVEKNGKVTAYSPGTTKIYVENFDRSVVAYFTIKVQHIEESNYFFVNKNNSKYITVSGNSESDNAQITVSNHNGRYNSGYQVWSIVPLNDNYVAIKNVKTDKYLCANSASSGSLLVQKANPTNYYQWKIVWTQSGFYKLVLSENELLCLSTSSSILSLEYYTNDSNLDDEWDIKGMVLKVNIYYDDSFILRKSQDQTLRNYTNTNAIQLLMERAINQYRQDYGIEILINQITFKRSSSDDCPFPLNSMCECKDLILGVPIPWSHSKHHTNWENIVVSNGVEGKSVNIYFTGRFTCGYYDGEHTAKLAGICYSGENKFGVRLIDLDTTRETVFHELGHLFGAKDHPDKLFPSCTYTQNNDEWLICQSCRDTIHKNVGRYF